MSRVSVVMVSYHTGAPLWLAIESALEQPDCHELVLVDNGNIPGVAAILERLAATEPRFRLITGQGNVGFAKGCNLGARASSGDVLLLLNPDCMLSEGAITRALEVLGRHPPDTLAGCYLVNPDGTEQRGCRRNLLNPRNAALEGLGLERIFKEKEPLNITGPMPEAAHEVPAISGAFMMLSRGFYDHLGGLDEGYFLHMEDMDLCMRVHKAGGRVICMPEVVVIHFRSTSEVPSATVERHKAVSFIRYLTLYFSASHSASFMKGMTAAIWLRFYVMRVIHFVDGVFIPPLAAKREISRVVMLYRLTRFWTHDDSLAGKTVLVTGASGQVGLCVVGKALARGAQVIAAYNTTAVPFVYPGLTWVWCDMNKDLLEHKADILIHTAPLPLLPGTLETLINAGVRRVVAFGCTQMLVSLEGKCKPEAENIRKLKAAEEEIMRIADERNVATTILRPTLTYGIGLDTGITRFANIMRRFGLITLHGEGSGLRNPVQATDLAQAALDACNNPSTYGKEYNLGGSQSMTYIQMLSLISQYLGKQSRIVRPPMFTTALDWLGWMYQLDGIHGEMARRMNKDLVFESEDAIKDFGYNPKAYLQGSIVL